MKSSYTPRTLLDHQIERESSERQKFCGDYIGCSADDLRILERHARIEEHAIRIRYKRKSAQRIERAVKEFFRNHPELLKRITTTPSV